MSNLKNIFESITPENIKDIPLIRDAMDIFIENLEQNSYVSSKIRDLYKNEYTEDDSDIIKASKKKLRESLLDLYLFSLHDIIKAAQKNKAIQEKLSNRDNAPLKKDIHRVLNDEFFIANKELKQKIGTKKGIEYIYNLAQYLENSEKDSLRIHEIKPFYFRVEGSIFKDSYENIVKPLSHPLGFVYNYSQIMEQTLTDLFGVDIVYNIKKIEIVNINSEFYSFVSYKENDQNLDYLDSLVKQDFLNRINPRTGQIFTDQEYEEQVKIVYGKTVETYKEISNPDGRDSIEVLFTDGTFIQQKFNPIELIYINYIEFGSFTVNNILDLPLAEQWSLLVDYDVDYKFNYEDSYFDIVEISDISGVGGIDNLNVLNTVENYDIEHIMFGDNYYFYTDDLNANNVVYFYTEDGYYITSSEDQTALYEERYIL